MNLSNARREGDDTAINRLKGLICQAQFMISNTITSRMIEKCSREINLYILQIF